MDPILTSFISNATMRITDESATIAAINALDSMSQKVNSTNAQLAAELQAAQQSAADLQKKLDAVNLDDASAQAKVLLLLQQIAQVNTQITAMQSQLDSLHSVVVFDNLEFNPWLLAPGASANSGQAGSLTTATQSIPGVNCAWLATAPKGPYANAYFYQQLDPHHILADRKTFTYEQGFMVPTAADANAPQAIELDIQQVISHRVVNPGFQWDFVANKMNVWNRSLATPANTGGGDWEPIGKTCPRWTPGKWMQMKFECHRDDANTVFMDAATFDGTRMPLGISFNTPILPDKPDMLNCAIQLDGNSIGTAFRVYIDRVRFTASR